MVTLRVDPDNPDAESIDRAAAVIRSGGLVAFPTETVYGLGANALDDAAVAGIYATKGRPAYNPLIVHVLDATAAAKLTTGWSELADRLARAFWPGPLTLVLPRADHVPDRVSAGLSTVAIRVPAHPVALALLRASGVPIVAPSANPSMAVSPTTAAHVERGLGDRVALILDGGPAGVGIESTVLDLTGERPVLLRPGALSTDDLAPLAGEVVEAARAHEGAARPSPGMQERHYAPRATMVLFDAGEAGRTAERARRAAAEGRIVAALLLDPARGSTGEDAAGGAEGAEAGELAGDRATGVGDIVEAAAHVVRLPPDAAAYARALYSVLHRMDDLGCDLLLVQAPPDTPAWAGIRDRLRRAAEAPPG